MRSTALQMLRRARPSPRALLLARGLSSGLPFHKASPTVMRLIREHGLESYPSISASGPKNTLTADDVAVAAEQKSREDEESLQPITSELREMKGHMIDNLPTQAVTNKKELLEYFKTMYVMRRMEIAADVLYKEKQVKGFCHLYDGQEAVGMGIEAAVTWGDSIVTSYRDHTWQYTRGDSVKNVLGELMGKYCGPAKGKGGSMHFFDNENYFMGGYAIVGGHLPIAVGTGLSIAMKGEVRVVLAFFGDGASNQGVFHEALNMAKLWDLPMIFVCENNFYGIATDVRTSSSYNEIHKKAAGYGIPGHVVNGMDVLAVREACEDLVRNVRQGSGPVLLEARCYRYQGHSMTDPGKYRSQAEADLWKKRDPIPRLEKELRERGDLDDARVEAIRVECNTLVEDAMQFAEASPEPSPAQLYEDIYVEEHHA